MKSAHGIGPVVIGVMQVAAMVRGSAGVVQSGEGGFWAMIERNLSARGGYRSGIKNLWSPPFLQY
ncbi:conserved hypothetical protein [Pseudomonas veronii]|nr:conserved hypothetical protein [Pseudomonas veronii]